MQRQIAAKQRANLPGVFEVIADGFSLAMVRPFLLVLPLLVDLYYWVGWKVTIPALTSPLKRWVLETDAAGANDVAEKLDTIGRSDASNVLSWLVPSLLANLPRSEIYELDPRPVYTSSHWWIDLPMVIAMVAGAALLLAIYGVPLADAVLDRSRSVMETIRAILSAWMRLLLLLLCVVGIGLLVLAPLAAVCGLMIAAGVEAAPLFAAGLGLFLFTAYTALWFAPDAIVAGEVGAFEAIKRSLLIVRRHFWPTVTFVLTSAVIGLGLDGVWESIADSESGLLLGVFANAFFATGLAIASISFYVSRARVLLPGTAI